MSQVAV